MAKCFIGIDDKSLVSIELFDNSVATKFLDELKWHVSNSSIDNQEAFYSYADEATIQSDLLNAIRTVNTFLRTNFIELPSNIDWDDHDIYNYFHEKFEQLNGKWGAPTKILTLGPESVRRAIRMINFAVHSLERRPYQRSRRLYLSWDKESYRRQRLADEEHAYFTNIIQPNTVYLNYVEVGKNLLDLYHDGLDPQYNGYENLHYVGAEIVIEFGTQSYDMFDQGFRDWAKSNKVDLEDKMLGIGKIPIGTFEGSDDLFTKDSNVTNIQIKE